MGTNRKQVGKQAVWAAFVDQIHAVIPHASSWWGEEDGFRELRLKRRDDGSTLAIAKGYGPDGGEVVCFGSGYGVVGALMAIDAAIQGGAWRVDKPWSDKGK